jgi:hypothetical protein
VNNFSQGLKCQIVNRFFGSGSQALSVAVPATDMPRNMCRTLRNVFVAHFQAKFDRFQDDSVRTPDLVNSVNRNLKCTPLEAVNSRRISTVPRVSHFYSNVQGAECKPLY